MEKCAIKRGGRSLLLGRGWRDDWLRLGKGGESFTPLDVALDNGGYNGTVVVPIRMSMGTITGKTCCTTMVLAKLGDQVMFIGSSTGGTAPNSGNCGGTIGSGLSPGTILN
ncbi:MAG: hypothetical protein KQI78_10400 [Deltaproteobacteria bacterium]|nr:hypothetical protein [Deltaproteobacteria bacterium]